MFLVLLYPVWRRQHIYYNNTILCNKNEYIAAEALYSSILRKVIKMVWIYLNGGQAALDMKTSTKHGQTAVYL